MPIYYCTCGNSLGNYTTEREGRNAVTQHQLSHQPGILAEPVKVVPQEPEPEKK